MPSSVLFLRELSECFGAVWKRIQEHSFLLFALKKTYVLKLSEAQFISDFYWQWNDHVQWTSH